MHIDHGALAEIRVSVQNQLVGDILQRCADTEQNRQGRACRCPRVDAQRKRIRQHIAHHGLQNRTGDRQTCTDRNAQKQTRQADIPHDGIGGLKLSWQSGAEKMVRGNRTQVGDIQRGRPDNDAESKDCDQGAKNNS